MKHGSHHDYAKTIISLFIVLVAFGILALFNTYSGDIIESDSFPLFMTLTVVGSGLLVGLMYLVNNSKHSVRKAHSAKSVKGKRKTK